MNPAASTGGVPRRSDGLLNGDGELAVVARRTMLSPAQSRSLARLPAPPKGPHPWPDEIHGGGFGNGRATVAITHVQSALVAEVTADTAVQPGRFRHLSLLRAAVTMSAAPAKRC